MYGDETVIMRLVTGVQSMFPEIKKTLVINGIEVPVLITVAVHEDEFSVCLDQDFATPQQKQQYADKFERGELFCATIVVTAHALGLEGTDSLGACELVPNNYFNSEPFEASVRTYLTEHGMIENAEAELKASIQGHAEYLRASIEQLQAKAEEFSKFELKAGGK